MHAESILSECALGIPGLCNDRNTEKRENQRINETKHTNDFNSKEDDKNSVVHV
jgi:hypothetical protein